MSYWKSIKQNVVADTNNSSTTNLTSGNSYTFTGAATSTLGIAGIQVSLKTDQNATVYVDQAPDLLGNWDVVDYYDYLTTKNFGFTIQAINSYVRIRVVLVGTTATTYFRLQTALCPIVEALPRSLSPDGHLQTHLMGDMDHYGFECENTPIGEKRVVTPVRLAGRQFDGAVLDTNFWTATNANGGTAVVSGDELIMSTNTPTPNGSTKINSITRARFVPSETMSLRGVVQLSAGITNNKRRWGGTYGATMPTITDGAYFELDGSTFSIVTMKGSSETRVSSGSFNGDYGLTYAPGTDMVIYEIYWTQYKVWFVIGNKLLHTVSATSTTWTNSASLYIYIDNVNSLDITTNSTLQCRAIVIRRLGPLTGQPISKYQTGTTTGVIYKYGPGNLRGIVVGGVANGSTVILYDGTAVAGSPVIWSSGSMPNGTNPFSLDFKDLPFANGLFLVVSGANSNVTTIYE